MRDPGTSKVITFMSASGCRKTSNDSQHVSSQSHVELLGWPARRNGTTATPQSWRDSFTGSFARLDKRRVSRVERKYGQLVKRMRQTAIATGEWIIGCSFGSKIDSDVRPRQAKEIILPKTYSHWRDAEHQFLIAIPSVLLPFGSASMSHQ